MLLWLAVVGVSVVVGFVGWGVVGLGIGLGSGGKEGGRRTGGAGSTRGTVEPTAGLTDTPVVTPNDTDVPISELPAITGVDVPAGPFIMGSNDHGDDEKPPRTVDLPALRISKYETTKVQNEALVAA